MLLQEALPAYPICKDKAYGLKLEMYVTLILLLPMRDMWHAVEPGLDDLSSLAYSSKQRSVTRTGVLLK